MNSILKIEKDFQLSTIINIFEIYYLYILYINDIIKV